MNFRAVGFRKGLVSHTAMLIIVTVSYPFMVFMNLGGAMDAFIFAMLSAYGASILASLSALGVEIPFIDRFVKKNIDKDKFNLIEEEEKND